MNRSIAIVLLALTCAGTAVAAPALDEAALEQRMEAVRERLDAAARELAELHRQKYRESDSRQRAWLGVLISDRSTDGGILLDGVTPGGGAAEVGLKAGDKVLAVDDIELLGTGDEAMKRLTGHLRSLRPGDTVALRYQRGGEIHEVAVVTRSHLDIMLKKNAEELARMGDKIAAEVAAAAGQKDPLVNLSQVHVLEIDSDQPQLVDMDEDLARYFGVRDGVLVLQAPAGAAGLESGDVLLSVAGEAPADARTAVQSLLTAQAPVPVTVRRRGRTRELTVDGSALFPGLGSLPAEGRVRVIRIERHGDDVKVITSDDEGASD